MGFAASVRANSNKALLKLNTACYKIARELFSSVVALTPSPSNPGPTARGLLANQWYPMEGMNFSNESGLGVSPNGADSLARINAINGLQFFKKDGVVTMTNNEDYAVLAEYIGWNPPRWKGTQPYRMVARSIQLIAAKYK